MTSAGFRVNSLSMRTPLKPAHAAITAVGGYLPEDRLTNFDLEKMVDTNDEWIRTRTGIEERRILKDPKLATSDMAAFARCSMATRSAWPMSASCG